jgi:hypothetical protein
MDAVTAWQAHFLYFKQNWLKKHISEVSRFSVEKCPMMEVSKYASLWWRWGGGSIDLDLATSTAGYWNTISRGWGFRNRWRRTSLLYSCTNRPRNWRGYSFFFSLEKIICYRIMSKAHFPVVLQVSRRYASPTFIYLCECCNQWTIVLSRSCDLSKNATFDLSINATLKNNEKSLDTHPITDGLAALRCPTC